MEDGIIPPPLLGGPQFGLGGWLFTPVTILPVSRIIPVIWPDAAMRPTPITFALPLGAMT